MFSILGGNDTSGHGDMGPDNAHEKDDKKETNKSMNTDLQEVQKATRRIKEEGGHSIVSPHARDILQIILSDNIGPLTFNRLLDLYGSPRDIIRYLRSADKPRGFKLATQKKAEDIISNCRNMGIHVITCMDDDFFPSLLQHTEDCPPVLFCKGCISLLRRPCLSIVGTRTPSYSGQKMAEFITQKITQSGFVTVSGLARGIDAIVHSKSPKNQTIAVLGCGVDVVYPHENKALQHNIAIDGLLISEYLPGTLPTRQNFPRRNRIIAGLSMGTIVVEARKKSGSLITAKCALEYNRDIFAVPGSPLDPRSQGCNQLVREGAQMLEDPSAIIKHYSMLNMFHDDCAKDSISEEDAFPNEKEGGVTESEEPKSKESNSETVRKLRFLIGVNPQPVDDLIAQTGASVHEVNEWILEQELMGNIVRYPGNRIGWKE